MDLPRKQELAKSAIDSIATHHDADGAVLTAVMDNIAAFAAQKKAEVDARVQAEIAALTAGEG